MSSPWDTAPQTDNANGADASSSADWLQNNEPIQIERFDFLDPFKEAVIPLDKWVDASLEWVVANFRDFFQISKVPIEATLNAIESFLLYLSPLVVILFFALLAWQVGSKSLALGSLLSLTLIGLIGAWEESMITLSLVVTSVLFSIIVGLPLGVLSSKNDRANNIIRPILDAMQTTPAFVYLIPIVMLFGIGNVPGVIVTIIFALPPLIRLTNLGIRQVPADLIEASQSFGASKTQMLFKVELPVAMPTIMAGINQTLMLALSMVVIASMIAVGGLGQMVLRGIGRLDIGLASIGGIGIVLLAVILDRLTQSMGRSERKTTKWYKQGPLGLVFYFTQGQK